MQAFYIVAWYSASTASATANSSQVTIFTQSTITADSVAQINCAVTEHTSGNAAKLMLTTKDAITADSNSIDLPAGGSAYYNGTVDKAHMYEKSADATHLKAIAVDLTFAAHSGFSYTPNATIKVKVHVADPGRLGVTLETCTTESAKYVGANIDVIAELTVNSTGDGFSAGTTQYAYLSVSGTHGDETSVQLGTNSWTFTVVDSGTANAITSAPSEPAYSGS